MTQILQHVSATLMEGIYIPTLLQAGLYFVHHSHPNLRRSTEKAELLRVEYTLNSSSLP